MDPFTESELFDDDALRVSAPQGDEGADPLTVLADGLSPRLHRAGVPRRVVYAVVALAVLVATVLASRAVHPSSEHHPSRGAVHRHQLRARPRKAGPRVWAGVHHDASGAPAPVPVGPSRAIVDPPSSWAERPTRDESVGSGRPSSPSPVGKTEQFAYLGK